jgi:predicted nucleic acid-binding Zn ribbon protein
MYCNSCQKSVPPSAAICPHCGQLLMTADERRRQQWRIILAIAATAAILLAWRFLVSRN